MTASEMLHKSPLYRLIEDEWPNFEPRLATVQATEDDLLLYVVWTLDSLRDEDNDEKFYTGLWTYLRHKLRDHFILNHLNQSGDDLNVITDVTLAFTLRCWGLILNVEREYMFVYYNVVHNLGMHERKVLADMEAISVEDWQALKEWLARYVESDVFCTVSDEMAYDMDLDIREADKLEKHIEYFPAMLPTYKTKDLYLTLRENNIIEQCVTEEDFLQLFGCRASEKELQPIKWLLTLADLLELLRGIYDRWEVEDKPSWNSITQIANNRFVKNNGEKYSASMKHKASYKGQNDIITDFLATI